MSQIDPIKWKRGEFVTFYAQLKIRVGGANPIDILAGDEFEYDGSIVKYAGAEFAQPGIRGAIRQQWATLDPDGQVPAAFHSDRSVAKSQTVNKDLSRVQRTRPSPVEMDHLDEETVLQVSDRSAIRNDATGEGHLTKDHNRRQASTAGQRALEVSQSDLDQQDHTPIARVKSKANLGKIDVTDPRNSGMARDLALRSHEEGYGAFTGQKRSPQVIEREGVTITTNVGDMSRGEVYAGDDDEGRVVGQVRHTNKNKRTQEGVSMEDTSGRPGKKATPAQKPTQKKQPARPSSNGDAVNSKLRVAQSVFPDFPENWNFYGKTEDKFAALKKLGASSDMIKALFASESSSMKKELKKRFPKHFS